MYALGVTLIKNFVGWWLEIHCSRLQNMETIVNTMGEGNGIPLQYSCLENSMDRGAWQATVHGVTRAGHDLATKPPLIILIAP